MLKRGRKSVALAAVMCETPNQQLVVDNGLGNEVPVKLEKIVEKSPVVEPAEPFDLYEWALDFSRAAGFECERVELPGRN
jgi:hypothetical protein